MKRTNLIYSLLVLLFFSCDTIKDPLIPVESRTVQKNILLEDYTGMKCPNCPDAAQQAVRLKELYGDKLILVSIHTGVHAKPSGIFVSDFRTAAGDAYNAYYGFTAYPAGLVDRSPYKGKAIIDHDQWDGALDMRSSIKSPVDIEIDNQWNESKREAGITINLTFTEEVSDAMALQLWLLEDNIVAPQINGQDVVYEYVHNHVLRDAINGTWGSDLFQNTLSALKGNTFSYSYTYTLKTEWKSENCSVIAFVYKKDDKSVIQCEEKKLHHYY